MDGAEWGGWLAFAALEPFGPLRDDLRAGEIASAAFGAQGVRVKPADVFATLRPRRAARAGGAETARAVLSRMCPALTPIRA